VATITRGATELAPALILGWHLTRPTRSVVHGILGTDEVELTTRPPGPWAGDLRTFWASEAAATAAAEALAVPGGPWEWDVLNEIRSAYATGDITIEAADDEGRRWIVTVGVTEAGS
jgi:hypothetical protein